MAETEPPPPLVWGTSFVVKERKHISRIIAIIWALLNLILPHGWFYMTVRYQIRDSHFYLLLGESETPHLTSTSAVVPDRPRVVRRKAGFNQELASELDGVRY